MLSLAPVSIATLGIVLALASCGPLPTRYLVIVNARELTSAEMQGISVALERWQRAVPVSFSVTVSQECPGDHLIDGLICLRVVSDVELAALAGEPLGKFVGWTEMHRSGGDAYLWGGLPPDDFVTIAAHELGHAQGLYHTGAGSLMFPINDSRQASGPTEVDIEQWWGLR